MACKPIPYSNVHAYKLPASTWPAELAITPRGNVIISRAFHIAINYLKERALVDQKGENSRTERTMLEEMEEMLTSGIFFNNHNGEQ